MSVSRDGRHVRRRRLTIGCVVAALLLHAAAAWLLLRSAPALPPRSAAQTALAVRWLHVSAPQIAHAPDQAAPQRTPLRSEAARPRPARVARRVRAAAAAPVFVTEPVVVTPPAVTPVAIDGGVFALPRIGYGDAPGAAGVRAFAVTAATPPTPPTGAHEALRRHIAWENAVLLPVARTRLQSADLRRLAQKLAARRGVSLAAGTRAPSGR